ncbi:MAG: response regulator transcription factor [Bacteroidales bacterium]|nr:response regulator transcription factor [Bacteroidales bacterium]
MKEPAVTIVVEDGFMQAALRNILKYLQPEVSLVFRGSLEECLNGKTCPRFIILDSKLLPQPHCYSLEKLKSRNPEGHILIVETSLLEQPVLVYANEVILRNDTEKTINQKIKNFFDQASKLAKPQYDDTISEREKEIVRLVALGKTNKEISGALFISPHTVVTHRKNITSKLGIKTIAGLTVYAILNGLIVKEEI